MKREPKYRFNRSTLSYEKVEFKFSFLVLRVFSALILLLFAGGTFSYLVFSRYDTPAMKELRDENIRLMAQYQVLNHQLDKVEKVLDDIQHRDDNIYRIILDSDPIPESVRKAGFGGTDSYENLEALKDIDLVIRTSKKLDLVTKQAYIQSKSYEEVLEMALEKEDELISVPAIIPLANKDYIYTSSGYGMRIHPVYKVRKFHYGIDFVAPQGANVHATGAGKVVKVRKLRNGHGWHVVIDHGFGYETLYAHLSGFNVKTGQSVQRGDVIGYVGSTGTSTANHLHYEVHKDGRIVNPNNYFFKDLSADEYEELVALSSNIRQSFD